MEDDTDDETLPQTYAAGRVTVAPMSPAWHDVLTEALTGPL